METEMIAPPTIQISVRVISIDDRASPPTAQVEYDFSSSGPSPVGVSIGPGKKGPKITFEKNARTPKNGRLVFVLDQLVVVGMPTNPKWVFVKTSEKPHHFEKQNPAGSTIGASDDTQTFKNRNHSDNDTAFTCDFGFREKGTWEQSFFLNNGGAKDYFVDPEIQNDND